ncbi:DUF3592 domain-containing protein [Microlunatus antarcticus]|uniref:DUF3592 domain-containing protein n=1 Tax=Microlunatus antarcticus TaxID=53388 RepID=A0A7W5JYG9_9ACTN|nr:hypothetical protein [Microlunatus antarcticus]
MTFGQAFTLLSAGFVLLGAVFVVLGARTLASTRRRRRTWHAYPGRVVATRPDGDLVRCQVAYRRDGTQVLFWNRYTSSVLRDPVGRDVPVLVNPADPHDAVVDGGIVDGSTVGVVFVVVGSLAVVIGLVVGLVALT